MPRRTQDRSTLVLILSWWDVKHGYKELWKGATWRSEPELLSRRRCSFAWKRTSRARREVGRGVTVRDEANGEDGKDCREVTMLSDCFIFYFGT